MNNIERARRWMEERGITKYDDEGRQRLYGTEELLDAIVGFAQDFASQEVERRRWAERSAERKEGQLRLELVAAYQALADWHTFASMTAKSLSTLTAGASEWAKPEGGSGE